jgi:hypothetical protein
MRLHPLLALIVIVVVSACAEPKAVDIQKERDSIDDKVCSQTTLDDVARVLTELGFEYHIDASHSRILSTRHYGKPQLVEPVITMQLLFDPTGRMTSCKIEARFAGP